jgi:hypothetical protein
MPADLGFDSFGGGVRSYWVTAPTGGTGPDKEQRMASGQSAAVVEWYWRWLTVPANHERTPRDSRLSMDDWDAVAQLADRPQPNLAA